MKFRIDSVKTLAQPVVEKLKKSGLETFADLRPYLKDPKMLDELSKKTGIEKDDLRPVLGMVDLSRLGSLEPKTAEVLVRSGVHSVDVLRQQNPEKLVTAMKAVSATKPLETGDLTHEATQRWIEEAKTMEPALALR